MAGRFRGILILWVLFINVIRFKVNSQAMCDEPIWPDWTCHAGYVNGTSPDMEGLGHLHILINSNSCRGRQANPIEYQVPKSECFQSCILERVYIYKKVSGQYVLNDEAAMEERLNYLFFSDGENESAKRIANRVVTMCSNIIEESGPIPCEERVDAYKCLENAWAC